MSRVDLTPWARKGISIPTRQLLDDVVPQGVSVFIGKGKNIWSADVLVPTLQPVRIHAGSPELVATAVIRHLAKVLPGHTA